MWQYNQHYFNLVYPYPKLLPFLRVQVTLYCAVHIVKPFVPKKLQLPCGPSLTLPPQTAGAAGGARAGVPGHAAAGAGGEGAGHPAAQTALSDPRYAHPASNLRKTALGPLAVCMGPVCFCTCCVCVFVCVV